MRPAPGAAPASPSAARELRQDPDAAARARTRPLARASAGAAARGRAMGADRRHPGSARDARARARGGGAGGGGARGPRAAAGNGEPPGVARRVAARGAARGLGAAWLALEVVVAEEERRWSPELESLERWRPSLWPLLILWTPVAAALVWLGLALGGYVPAPAWLATRLGF